MKSSLFFIVSILLLLFCQVLYSQSNKKPQNDNLNRDSIVKESPYAVVFHREVVVFPKKTFASEKEKTQYDKLKHNFLKVYPYALEISKTYRNVEDSLSYFPSNAARKKYIKKRETEIYDYYKPKLINFTISQSVLLVKLLDRETGSSAYNIIEDLRGSIRATFWQGFALVLGNNLKKEYDSNGKDREIEELVIMYKSGMLR